MSDAAIPKKSKFDLGKVFLIGSVIYFVSWLVSDSDEGGSNGRPVQDQVAQEMAGPNSTLVKKLNTVHPNSAYALGQAEGAIAGQIFRVKAGSSEMDAALSMKNDQFGLVAKLIKTNHVDKAILSRYADGWNDGWNSSR